MPDIHGELVLDENIFNTGGQRIFAGQVRQFPDKLFFIGKFFKRLHKHHRNLTMFRADTSERTAVDLFMIVEYGFHGDGEQRLFSGFNPVGLSAAEPDSALRILPAQISHSMTDVTVLANFSKAVGLWIVIIVFGYQGSCNGNFAYLPRSYKHVV